MGNKKQKQMKVFAYLALICGVSAIKLSQKHSHLPTAKLIKVAHKIQNKSKAKAHGVNELEAWGAEQLADGGTITKAEAHEKMVALGVPESMMDELEAAFDAVDADGNGELDAAEVEAAMAHMGLDENVDYPTEDEIIAAVEAELARDGGITKEEAAGAIAHWADENGVTIPQEAWDVMEAGFDAVDADGDGELTAEEIGAAFPPKGKGKKGPKGKALVKIMNRLKNKKGGKPHPHCPPPGAVSEEDAEAIKAAVAGMPEDFEVTPEMYLEAAEAEGIELNDEDMEVATAVFHAIDQDGNGAHSKGELQDAINWLEENC